MRTNAPPGHEPYRTRATLQQQQATVGRPGGGTAIKDEPASPASPLVIVVGDSDGEEHTDRGGQARSSHAGAAADGPLSGLQQLAHAAAIQPYAPVTASASFEPPPPALAPTASRRRGRPARRSLPPPQRDPLPTSAGAVKRGPEPEPVPQPQPQPQRDDRVLASDAGELSVDAALAASPPPSRHAGHRDGAAEPPADRAAGQGGAPAPPLRTGRPGRPPIPGRRRKKTAADFFRLAGPAARILPLLQQRCLTPDQIYAQRHVLLQGLREQAAHLSYFDVVELCALLQQPLTPGELMQRVHLYDHLFQVWSQRTNSRLDLNTLGESVGYHALGPLIDALEQSGTLILQDGRRWLRSNENLQTRHVWDRFVQCQSALAGAPFMLPTVAATTSGDAPGIASGVEPVDAGAPGAGDDDRSLSSGADTGGADALYRPEPKRLRLPSHPSPAGGLEPPARPLTHGPGSAFVVVAQQAPVDHEGAAGDIVSAAAGQEEDHLRDVVRRA